MTIQLTTPSAGTSKAALRAALASDPSLVRFHDPSIMGPRSFSAADIKPGERFPFVLDPATRRRFATLERRPDGSFRVE